MYRFVISLLLLLKVEQYLGALGWITIEIFLDSSQRDNCVLF